MPVVVAVASIPSIVLFQKDYPRLSLTLLLLPAIALVWALGPSIRTGIGQALALLRHQLLAWRNTESLRSFAARFSQFVDPNRSDTLRDIAFRISGNNWEETYKIIPPNYIHDWFHCFQVDLESRIFRFRRFARLTQHFTWIVNRYNQDYVLRARAKLRQYYQFPSSPQSLPEIPADQIGRPQEYEIKQLSDHYRDELDFFRERYVRFLYDLQQWLNNLNNKLGPRSRTHFMDYFEHPGRF